MENQGEKEELIDVEKDTFLNKIKKFFINIFNKKTKTTSIKNIKNNENFRKESFLYKIKATEKNKEIEIIKLQKEYHNGNLKEENLTMEQIDALLKLYDEQILEIGRKIENKKKELLKYYSTKQ